MNSSLTRKNMKIIHHHIGYYLLVRLNSEKLKYMLASFTMSAQPKHDHQITSSQIHLSSTEYLRWRKEVNLQTELQLLIIGNCVADSRFGSQNLFYLFNTRVPWQQAPEGLNDDGGRIICAIDSDNFHDFSAENSKVGYTHDLPFFSQSVLHQFRANLNTLSLHIFSMPWQSCFFNVIFFQTFFLTTKKSVFWDPQKLIIKLWKSNKVLRPCIENMFKGNISKLQPIRCRTRWKYNIGIFNYTRRYLPNVTCYITADTTNN